jgi:hypothetical protein
MKVYNRKKAIDAEMILRVLKSQLLQSPVIVR